MADPVQMTTRSASASDIFYPFQGSVTGTTPFDVWVPASTKRYILRGFQCVAIVKVVLVTGASNAHALYFKDSASPGAGGTICAIGPYATNAAVDTVIRSGDAPQMEFGPGIPGSALGTKLQIASGNDIGSGVIRFTGVVWGVEVPR